MSNNPSSDNVVSKDSNKDSFCSYCKKKGHVKQDCYKLKRKEQFQQSTSTTASTTSIAAVEPTVPVTATEPDQEVSSTVASVSQHVSELKRREKFMITVNRINDVACNLCALVDSGSSVSMIKSSAFETLFNSDYSFVNQTINRLSAVNSTIILTKGIFPAAIKLKDFPNLTCKINMQILDNPFWSTDIILGQDFIQDNLIYVLLTRQSKVELWSEIASTEIVDQTADQLELSIENIQIDFDNSTKAELINVIKDVNNTVVDKTQEEYLVKVALKNQSVFAYAPRRFAWSERIQIKEITDDLLSRGIIKHSNSPYCARVVPVRKKNGTLRLCVDLRPLNDRVMKQRYPFPLIEDCLSRLGNKRVFTLLDLKDGFHQIRVHPDHCKYFSFATPDGQYEYNSLPFGFCESPAEFQRR